MSSFKYQVGPTQKILPSMKKVGSKEDVLSFARLLPMTGIKLEVW